MGGIVGSVGGKWKMCEAWPKLSERKRASLDVDEENFSHSDL